MLLSHHDLRKKGVYAIKTANGSVLFDTFADTGYSAREQFICRYNKGWAAALEEGFYIAEFTHTGVCLTSDPVPDKPSAIKVPTTANGWSLYDYAASELAAKDLGELLKHELEKALADGRRDKAKAVEIREVLYRAMERYSWLGACDTEPETILVDTITRVLGLEEPLGR